MLLQAFLKKTQVFPAIFATGTQSHAAVCPNDRQNVSEKGTLRPQESPKASVA